MAARLPADRTVVVVNKIDLATHEQVLSQLGSAAELEASAYFPISSVTGEGVPELLDHLSDRMPEGPAYFRRRWSVTYRRPNGWRSWCGSNFLRRPATSCLLDRHEGDGVGMARARVEIVVERESQKRHGHRQGRFRAEGRRFGGQDGDAGGAFLELHVTVDKDWQRRPDRITRLGY